MTDTNKLPQTAADLKSRSGVGRILKAGGYSMAGFKAAYQSEAAFRQLVLLAVIFIPLAFFFEVTPVERGLLIGVVWVSLIVELLNSAIEATVDRISLELHPLSGQAKDMGSAAQFIALTLVGSVWALILL